MIDPSYSRQRVRVPMMASLDDAPQYVQWTFVQAASRERPAPMALREVTPEMFAYFKNLFARGWYTDQLTGRDKEAA